MVCGLTYRPRPVRWRSCASIFLLLLGVDWILGACQANGVIPAWTFALANVPFGIAFVWFEAQWTGTAYWVFGHRVGDLGSLVVFMGVVTVQAVFYCWWWPRWGVNRIQSAQGSKEPPGNEANSTEHE